MKKTMKIKIGPENWVQTIPLLLAVLESGTSKGKAMAREELTRMARVADRLVGNFPGFVDDSEAVLGGVP